MCEYHYRPLQEGGFDRIRPIWKAGFGDSDELLDSFRDLVLRAEDMQIAVCGGEPVASVALLPAALCAQEGAEERVACVYALTTLRKHRGKGVAAWLVRSAASRKRSEGVSHLVGSPEPELIPYYNEQGWLDAFSVRETEVTASESAAVHTIPVGAEKYLALREKALEGRDHVRWDVREVGFQRSICQAAGGGLFTFQAAAPCCAAVEYGEDGGFLACELLAPDELLLPCAAGLLERFSERSIRLRLPPWSGAGIRGGSLPFGLLLPGEGKPTPLLKRLITDRMAYLGFDFC